MNKTGENPFSSLNRIFHEPSRLSIMSALCGSERGMAFNELKSQCDLTDGNLSRHLKTLEEAKAVKIKKAFSGARPKTTVRITDLGREGFVEYLKTLEDVLHRAAEAVAVEERKPSLVDLLDGSFGVEGKA
ncbi:MAG: transcriptional regulator [Verrucomicrobiota bacterium]